MSKSKVRSMQRGAQKRSDQPPIPMQEIYKDHPPQISNMDKPHLNFIKFSKPAHVDKIKTVIEAADKNGIGTASEISRLLNKLLLRTAIGENWTPRLAWFAASEFRKQSRNAKRVHSLKQNDETKFQSLVKRAVNSRLDEIRNEFEASKPTLGEVLPELAALKMRLEGKTDPSA